jgi:signal transduction histidine kinase
VTALPTVAPAPGWRLRLARLRDSIGLQMLLLFVGFALALSLTFMIGMQRAFSGGWRELVRPLVADYVDRLAAELGSPPDLVRAQALVQRLPLTIVIDGPQLHWQSHPELGDTDPADAGEDDSEQPESLPPIPPPMLHRWMHPPSADGRPPQPLGPPLFMPPMHRVHAAWWLFTRHSADGHRIRFGIAGVPAQQRPRFIGWATLAVLLVFTALAYARVRHLLRPLHDIRVGAQRYGAGDFSQPIPLRRPDELGQLAGQVNTMAERLRGMLDAKRALLLAISHELRSPLTRARLNAELAEPGLDQPDERAAHAALLRDLSEMRDLVSELLESERLVGGHTALQPEPTDLAELVRSELAEACAQGRVRLQLAPVPALLRLDRMRLRLLLRNLVDNALKHSAASEPPLVSLSQQGDAVILSVRDHGPGVAAEHLPHLAEPFYRADAARQRATGGVGLGLYLCRLVAEAHGGQLRLRNAEPGLEVACHLPITEPAPAL